MSVSSSGRLTDVMRVRGYAMACATIARRSLDDLQRAVDRLVDSREAAEVALKRCDSLCEHAERIAIFSARASAGDVDPVTLHEAARSIELMVGQ